MLIDAISQGDMVKFSSICKSLTKLQTYQLLFTVDRYGYTLIH